jgi:hypothetical protein
MFTLHYVSNTNVRRVNRAIICLECSRTQGKADTINLEQLITFLNEKQRDPTLNEILYPLYDEKRALEIINDYEQNEVARSESKSSINKSHGIFRGTFLGRLIFPGTKKFLYADTWLVFARKFNRIAKNADVDGTRTPVFDSCSQ